MSEEEPPMPDDPDEPIDLDEDDDSDASDDEPEEPDEDDDEPYELSADKLVAATDRAGGLDAIKEAIKQHRATNPKP